MDTDAAAKRAKALEPRMVLGTVKEPTAVGGHEPFISIQNPVSMDFIYRRYVDFQDLMQTTPKYVKVRIVGTWENTDTYELVTFTLADDAEVLGIRHNRPLQVLVKTTGERLPVEVADGVRKYLVLTVLSEWDNIKRW